MFTLASCLVDQPEKSKSLVAVALICLQGKVSDTTILDFARLKNQFGNSIELEGDGFSDVGLIVAKDEFRNFQEISIIRDSRITDRGILAMNFPGNFSALRILGCPNLTEDSFNRIFMNIPQNMEILSLGPLTPRILTSFVHLFRKFHFKNLKSLKLEISRSPIPPKQFTEAAAAGAALLEEISRSKEEEISRSHEENADAVWVKNWRTLTNVSAESFSPKIPDIEKLEILKMVRELAVLLERLPLLSEISVSFEGLNFQEFPAIGEMKARKIQAAFEKSKFVEAVKSRLREIFPS